MCGLILAPRRSEEEMLRACKAMGYRSDGRYGIAHQGDWSLGHVRLAIQDLTNASAQPRLLGDGYFAYVGEIFSDHEDSELNHVAGLVRQGPEAFQNTDGFWAVARISLGGSATCWTDYLGQKPLYYWEGEQIVCSELTPMFELADKPAWDEIYFSNVQKWGYDPTGRTPYIGIRQLAPGTAIRLRQYEETEEWVYWDWGLVPQPTDLLPALRLATLSRLVGDLPVALLISGGLDSTLIHSILLEAGRQVRCFSWENGESEFLPPEVEPLPQVFPDFATVVEAMQTPVDLGSMVPQYALGQALKDQGFHVCLSGDGADELFGGYRRAKEYDSQMSDIFMELPYYHMPRLDRLMMRHTVELRSPYLAPEVVKFAMGLPYPMRTEKQSLKAAARGMVNPDIINRAKQPLKTTSVIQGGVEYRRSLVETFKCL